MVYYALLLSRIHPEIKKILRLNQNGFRGNRPSTSQILTSRQIIKEFRSKSLQATLLFEDSSKAFHSIHPGKVEQILLTYCFAKKSVTTKMTKAKVRSPDGKMNFFYIIDNLGRL